MVLSFILNNFLFIYYNKRITQIEMNTTDYIHTHLLYFFQVLTFCYLHTHKTFNNIGAAENPVA